ncbi:5-formyltetrahydrofolate cyclo-ligase [Sphingomonas ginsenosidivorax]|uniref:5-formyltetrahydrofolate cyclo-ligase n=1 Tax=Sphingomonas ginsenosidivorax TaxID=862135 RepID=UPI0013155082|nr:5-formyltetrahydrofolate cyclo-ligase [Sphingomonas ginsenosidivorax]
MSDAASTKASLRIALRRVRHDFLSGLSADQRDAALARIDAAITPLIPGDAAVAGYVAQSDEPDVLPFLASLHAAGRRVLLPCVRRLDMEFSAWSPADPLVPGYAGIPMPQLGGDSGVPRFLLVPLLGFDRQGGRIGQGGGFYDRYLEHRPETKRLGIAWSAQEVDEVPSDPWDVALTAVVTELETIEVEPPSL